MPRRSVYIVSLFFFLIPLALNAQGIQGVHILSEIAEGVYVAQPRFGGSNATIIINDDHVVVVDPPSSPANAVALVEDVVALTDNPIRYVVNTHWHGDHHGGNRGLDDALPGQITYIAHPNTRDDIHAEATPELRQFGSFYGQVAERAEAYVAAGVDEQGEALTASQKVQIEAYAANQRAFVAQVQRYEYLLPTLTVDSSLTLHGGGRTIKVLHLGRAHTRGDLIVYMPEEKILVSGDLLTAPYVVPRSGYPADYATVLRALAAMDFEQIVLGHGGPVKKDRALLLLMADFLEAVAAHADGAVAGGLSVEEAFETAKAEASLQAFEARIDWEEPGLRFLDFEGLLGMTVQRAYLEAQEGQAESGGGTSGFADVEGARLYYEVAGEGPPLVLLHGGFMDRRMWDPQFQIFAEHFRVLRYDRRGHGKTEVTAPSTPFSSVEDLNALLDHLGIEKAHIVGLSAGGTLAIDFALAHPERVSALVAAETAPSGFAFSEETMASMQDVFVAAQQEGRDHAIEVFLERPVFATARARPAAHRKIRELLEDNFSLEPLPERPLQPPALERLHDLEAETLFIIAAESGPNAPRAAAQMEAALPYMQSLVIPEAGHMVNLEQPGAFNEAVLKFLKGDGLR